MLQTVKIIFQILYAPIKFEARKQEAEFKILMLPFELAWWIVKLPFVFLFGRNIKKSISNPKKWKEGKNGDAYFKVRDFFVVICYRSDADDDVEGGDESLDGYYKLLIKKYDKDYYVDHQYEEAEIAIANAYSAVKQLELL